MGGNRQILAVWTVVAVVEGRLLHPATWLDADAGLFVGLLAAISWSPEVLRREVLAPTLGSLDRPTILAVTDGQGRVVYSRDPLDGAERLVTVAFGEALPSWRVALYQPRGADLPKVGSACTTVVSAQ